MSNIRVVPAAVVESLRRKANKLKKQNGIPHHEALDAAARHGGVFTNWHQVIEATKETEPSESAFKKGLVIGLDPKEADGIVESEYFTYDDRVLLFVLEELNEERRANGQSIEGEDYLDLVDDYSALVYLRCKNGALADFDQATKLCAKEFFFPPRYIRFNGEVKDDWLRADDEYD